MAAAHWPTPTSMDGNRGFGGDPFSPNMTLNKASALAHWPTARAADGEKNVRTRGGGAMREAERKGGPQDLCTAAQLVEGEAVLLKEEGNGPWTPTERAGWNTPAATDWKGGYGGGTSQERGLVEGSLGRDGAAYAPGPCNGFWADPDWIACRDNKWRPIEPGTFPLAHGAAARVGRLRAYGNAINREAAAHFIGSFLEAEVAALGDLVGDRLTDEGLIG